MTFNGEKYKKYMTVLSEFIDIIRKLIVHRYNFFKAKFITSKKKNNESLHVEIHILQMCAYIILYLYANYTLKKKYFQHSFCFISLIFFTKLTLKLTLTTMSTIYLFTLTLSTLFVVNADLIKLFVNTTGISFYPR